MSPLPSKLEITYQPLVSLDLELLESTSLRQLSVKYFYKIASGDIRGTRLENRENIGDLTDCFKIYFDETENQSPKYRIIFRYLPNSNYPKVLEIIAVGPRKNFLVYRSAIERPNR